MPLHASFQTLLSQHKDGYQYVQIFSVQQRSHATKIIFLFQLALKSGILFTLYFKWLKTENPYMQHTISYRFLHSVSIQQT